MILRHTLAPILVLALSAIVSGCLPATRTTTGSTPSAVTRSTNNSSDAERIDASTSDPSLDYQRRQVLANAREWLGVPYRYGGESMNGTDCSGFVQSVFSAAGHKLPRTSRSQSNVGDQIPLLNARPGDLVFFNTSGSGVSHVGIMISAIEFIHASTSRGVIVSRLDEGYYQKRLVFVRRVIE